MAERKHGAAAPATRATVTGESWYGRDLSGESHEGVLFVDLDLTEAEGRGAGFTECTFRRARFNVSAHEGAAFVNCTFSGCNFFDARFTGCKLVGSRFDRCTFEVMKVTGGNWSFVGLPGADLRSASFSGVQMREADLTGARFQGGSLRDVDLSGAWLRGADLSGCDLRGSDLSAVDPEFSPDGGTVLFWSNRPGGQGGGDLFVSRRAGEAWSAPEPAAGLNSAGFDFTPDFSRDGRWLYFASTRTDAASPSGVGNGQSDLYRVRASAVLRRSVQTTPPEPR